ncbi:MAG: LamG domain-containing protein [Rariglobus sp.]
MTTRFFPASRAALLLLVTALPITFTPATQAAVGTWNGGWPPIAGSYNGGSDANVPVTATVQESPPQITLTLHRAGAYTIYRKLRDGTSWGTVLATLPAGSTSYTDTSVNVGETYEYKVVISGVTATANSVLATGYLMAGIRVDKTAPRGRVVLVVTDTIATGLPAELDAYQRDLGADGWTVHTLVVASGDYSGAGNVHQAIRTQIQTLNTTYPGEVKNVILLGKVPAPRSGLSDGSRPDGHAASYAEATDSYYAEMDGNWTDTGANTQTGDIGNIAGDGKFDASRVTALGTGQKIELGFGRIDTSYGQTSHLATTRMYLEKLARYRHAADDFQPGRKGAIRKGYDNVDEAGWMSLTSLLGPGKIVAVTSTNDLPANPTGRYDTDGLFTRENQQGPFLFYFKGTGYMDMRDEDSRAVFLTGMQSNWGWWAEPVGGGQMAGRIGTDNFTLSLTWSIWGVRYFYHRLGLGGDMGDVLRTTLNNSSWSSGFYAYGTGGTGNGDKNGRLWINHFGDPTLRLFPVRPPRNLTATVAGAEGVSLAWTSSDDTALQGVHIYRAASPTGPWTQLTPAGNPYSGINYTDTPPSAGDWTYSVRAIKLENTPCGTYLNPSLGATITVQTATATSPLTITTTTLSPANWQTRQPIALQATGGCQPYTWSLAGGSLPDGLTLSADGVITGSPTRGGISHQPVFQVRDFRGATAQLAYELGVTTRRIFTIPIEADTVARSAFSFKDYNYGTANGLLIVRSHNSAPLYSDAFPYLRFTLPALAEGERLEAARLLLTLGGGSATTANTTLSVSLLADAGDAWTEGTAAGSPGTGAALTHTNRPTAMNPGVPATTLLAAFAPNMRISLDVFPHCVATLAEDPTRTLGLVVSSNTVSSLSACSRENPTTARPVVELSVTHQPLITVSRPLHGSVIVPSGQGLVLNAVGVDVAPITWTWSKLSGPGMVNFENPASPSTPADFSSPGRYSLQLTADDGELVSRKTIDVQVVSNAGYITKTDRLVLHYRFDEASGTGVLDSAPDEVAHNATFSAETGLAWSPTGGRVRGALEFTAPNSYVQTSDHDALDNTTRLSIALWVHPAAGTMDANIRGLLSKRTGTNAQEAYTIYLQNSRVYVRFRGSNGTINTTNPVVTAGQWTHIAAVYDGTQAGTANCVLIYINGVAVPLSGGFETDTSINNNTSPLWIGQIPAGNAAYSFLGLIDDVRIYRDRSLAATDVADLIVADAPRLTVIAPTENPLSGQPFVLTGMVTENGAQLPAPSASVEWSKSAGSPTVAFNAPAALTTNATATGAGFVSLRLTADDGVVTTYVDTGLTVTASTLNYSAWAAQIPWPLGADSTAAGDPDGDGFSNLLEYALNFDPLIADAPRLTVIAPAENPVSGQPFVLTGMVTENGAQLPAPSASVEWSKSAGSPTVVFNAPAALTTNATATGAGFVSLRLTADDGVVKTYVDTSLTVTASTLNYSAWAAQSPWPLGTDSTAAGDPDGDGFANLLEYALNFDPLIADAAAHRPSVSAADGHLAFSFTRDPALNTLTYEVQASPDLSAQSWTTLARSTAGAVTTNINGGSLSIQESTHDNLLRVTIVDAAPLTNTTRRFLRLQVTQP